MLQQERHEAQDKALPDRHKPTPVPELMKDIETTIKSRFFEEKMVTDEIMTGFIKDRKGEDAEAIRQEARLLFEQDFENQKALSAEVRPPSMVELKVNEAAEFDALVKTRVKGCCGTSVKTAKSVIKVDLG